VAEGLSDKNCYIQGVTLNGKDYPYSVLRHKDIMAGGELILKMGKKPGSWGKELGLDK
jgi:putative alpha-1,2-mannosidase